LVCFSELAKNLKPWRIQIRHALDNQLSLESRRRPQAIWPLSDLISGTVSHSQEDFQLAIPQPHRATQFFNLR
jgi:hypothetical protein